MLDDFDFFRRAFWGSIYDQADIELKERIRKAVLTLEKVLDRKNLITGKFGLPSYDDIAEKVAYGYKYVYQHATALKTALRRVLVDSKVRACLAQKNQWTILTLGDAFGVSNVAIMELLVSKFGQNGPIPPLVKNVTVDISESWGPYFYDVMKKAREELQLPTGQEDFFLQQDLLAENWSEGVLNAIQEADVICLNSFCSLIYRKPGYTRMLERILMSAKEGCVIILLDNLYVAEYGMYKVIPDRIEFQLELMCTEIWRAPKPVMYRSDRPVSLQENLELLDYFGHEPLLRSHPQPCFWMKDKPRLRHSRGSINKIVGKIRARNARPLKRQMKMTDFY